LAAGKLEHRAGRFLRPVPYHLEKGRKMKTQKILIVEDDVFSRGAMERILESHNYETSSCATAEEAVIKLQEESFGILITDLHLGDMDGLELIKEAGRIYSEISTILVTGLVSDEIRLRAKEEGVNGFFPKPIEWGELIGLLDVLTKTARDRNQNIQRNDGKARYPSLQRGIFSALMLFLLILSITHISEAQEPFPKLNRPNLRMNSQGMPMKPPALDLTEEQAKALDSLRRTYMAEAMPTRMELFALRIELRHLLSDPNVQPQILFDQQRKISALQAKLEELSLSYQVKARSIFTKEQFERLPMDWLLGMDTGYETRMGVGRGPRREPRW
jgi:DNA-binding response OmpR family regulator